MQISDINGWTHVNGTISRLVTCAGFRRFGQFGGPNPWATKTYNNLPPHYSVSISYENFDIRSVDKGEFSLLFVDDKIRTQSILDTGLDFRNNISSQRNCDGGLPQFTTLFPTAMSVNVTHFSPTMKLTFSSTINQAANDESFAISNLQIHIDECHTSCLTCDGPGYQNCLTCPINSNFINNNECYCPPPNISFNHQCISNNCPNNYILDEKDRTCQFKCSQNCISCQSKIQCNTCETNYYLLNGYCVNNCPFYTILNGNTCQDTTYSSSTNPYILAQDFSNKYISTPELIEKGWQPGIWESQTHDGQAYRYTNLATEMCNGLQLALGNQFNRYYTCANTCTFSNNYQNLPPHYGYNLQAQIWMGDLWQGESMQIEVDGNVIHTQAHTNTNSGVRQFSCGQNSNQAPSDYIFNTSLLNQPHTSDTLFLQFKWTQSRGAMFAWLALRDVQVTLLQCDSKCTSCINGTQCQTCIYTRQNPPDCNTPMEGYFDDGSNETFFKKCSYQCLECQGSVNNCTKCRFYDDDSKLPNCEKPDRCLKYATVKSVGFNQIQSQGSSKFIIDGINIFETSQRGITIVRLDYLGNFVSSQTFDTHYNDQACQDLKTYVDDIPLSHVVLLGIYDAGTNKLSSVCTQQLGQIGWNSNLNISHRDSYAVITRKTTSWLYAREEQQIKSIINNYSAYVEECIVECDFQCAECSGTASNCTKCRYYTASQVPECALPANCLTYINVSSQGLHNGNKFQAEINGSIPNGQTNSRGLNVVEINENGVIIQQKAFDTCGSNQAVLDLQLLVNNLNILNYLIMGVMDEGSSQFYNTENQGFEALETIGYDSTQLFGYRDALTIIGKKGRDKENTLQEIEPANNTGYSNIQQCLKECEIQCKNCINSSDECKECFHEQRGQNCSLPNNCGKFVHLKSVGYYYSKWHMSPKLIKIYVNDNDVTFSQNNGLHFLVFDENGQIADTQSFDYSQDIIQLSNMINFINNIIQDRSVLVVSKNDMSINFNQQGYQALQSLGLSDSANINFREAFVMIGKKGLNQGEAKFKIGIDKPGAVEIQECAVECQYQCGKCQIQPFTCLSCSSSTRKDTQECECIDGMFDVGIEECSKCEHQCGTCVTIKNNCLTCSDDNRDINRNKCECKDGYYEKEVAECGKCHNKCLTCTKQSYICLKCSDSTRIFEENCRCKDTFFDNGQAQCQKCQYPCSNCTGIDQCVSCQSLNRSIPQCTCQQGYYENDNNDCQQCSILCKSCDYDINNCIQCEHGKFRTLIPPQCDCIDGYYPIQGNIDCEPCNSVCKKCNINNICTECNNPLYILPECVNNSLYQKSCRKGLNRSTVLPDCNCFEGYHDFNKKSVNCYKCPNSCKKCMYRML